MYNCISDDGYTGCDDGTKDGSNDFKKIMILMMNINVMMLIMMILIAIL
jgi:hypothetical protein